MPPSREVNAQILNVSCTCSPDQIPLAASVVLSTVLLLRGLILAPELSKTNWTFCWTPVTSKPFNGTTFSRLFTRIHVGLSGYRYT